MSLVTWSDGGAQVGGVPIEKLANEYETPFYLYDRSALIAQFEKLRSAVPAPIEIYYSIKANPHPSIIRVFVEQGAGCEIASGGEYVLAGKAGVSEQRIVFAGPGKGRDELEFVIARGIGQIHVESFDELRVLDEITRALRKPTNICVRVNPSTAFGGGLLMGGQPTAFGFEEESLPDVLAEISRTTYLNLSGVHLYTGTQILDAHVLLKHWEHAVQVAKKTAEITKAPISTIDLGGGLGIPYFAHEKELDLDVLGKGARALVAEAESDAYLEHARFVVEPGRYLVGPSGLYVARVRSVKKCRGTTFVVLDGGMNHHLAASGNLGQVLRRDYPMMNLSRQAPTSESPLVIVGPLCTPIDTLGRKVSMAFPQTGDLIGILQSGAYGLTASPAGFLSHASPAEILVSEGKVEVITARVAAFESTREAVV